MGMHVCMHMRSCHVLVNCILKFLVTLEISTCAQFCALQGTLLTSHSDGLAPYRGPLSRYLQSMYFGSVCCKHQPIY